jgi:hypothetical protein
VFNNRFARILIVIYSLVIGFILMRLALGSQPLTIYASLIWFLLYPVILLRHLDTTVVFIILYMVFWSYIVLKNIFTYKYSALSTCLWTLVWMALLAAPFIPFGISYFSLARYDLLLYSDIVRIIPFISLLIVLILVNYSYFQQKLSTAIIWAMGLSTVIILMITLSDLLPALIRQPFLYALRYRFSFINTLIVKIPIIIQILMICASGLVLIVIDKNFIAETRKKGIAFRLILPAVITTIMFILIAFMQQDYNRYRNFDYSEGLTTIFLSNYQNKEIFWFDRQQVRVWSDNLKLLYPFGKFDLSDTLRAHARELGSSTIIEGMDLYKLERILKIMAYGPRDTIIYNGLKHIIEQRVFYVPDFFKPLLAKVRTRFTEVDKDIRVNGWVMLNNNPWTNITFCVNRWFEDGDLHFERMWQGTTDMNGYFEFTCFGGDTSTTLYFQIYFIVPALSNGNGFEKIRIKNIPHEIDTPGVYILDTINIELKPSDIVQHFGELIIEPRIRLDSIDISFPDMGYDKRVVVDGKISGRGELLVKNIAVDYLSETARDLFFEKQLKAKLRTWRFFGIGDDPMIQIRTNPQRRPLL